MIKIDPNKCSITEAELWKALYEDSSKDEPERELQSEDKNIVVSDESDEDEFESVLKKAHLSSEEMWSTTFGIAIFRNTMSKNGIQFILNCLRFDKKVTRLERKSEDKFVPIRDIWDMFIQSCKDIYTPAEYVIIDGQLLSLRGRCSFKMYSSLKPDKYGIKILMMCDA
ncbi:hypothetical protein JTB14_009651 [Gonioctena quinquepunctata]|nr:hypothetical protein JTB14_009651 [Gonioctena quinquepunctata]